MKKILILILLFPILVVAENSNYSSINEAIKNGSLNLDLRYRYEFVEQDNLNTQANASTLRTALGFKTASFYNFQSFVELEHVQVIGNELYNDTINGKAEYPVVADPGLTEMHQFYISYLGIDNSKAKIGRSILNLDDHRFVGDVAWRQNYQTYDGIFLENNSLNNTIINYAWINQVNRIFGEDSPQGTFNSNNHIVNINNKNFKDINLSTFAYLLDLEDKPIASSQSYGFKVTGKPKLTEISNLIYDASYAFQTDYADNPNSYNAHYINTLVGLGLKNISFALGYEVLGSDSKNASFQTPLATLHKFNGRADLFLTTPDEGLEDSYVKIDGDLACLTSNLENYKFEIAFHDFNSNEDNLHFGTEWNLMLAKKVHNNLTIELRYADYNAIDYAVDTKKFWLSLISNFST